MSCLVAASYADFKTFSAQFSGAGGKVFYCTAGAFKAWAMASGYYVLTVETAVVPGTFLTDFPGAVLLAAPLSISV